MIYFSDLKGKKVFTSEGTEIGRLQDLIFTASERPFINKLVIYASGNKRLIIPVEYLKKINNKVTLDRDYSVIDLEENELFIAKNLLDKQIIDIKGNKIVRVNDIFIQDKPQMMIVGVDIGILGIFRRLNLENYLNKFLMLFSKNAPTSDFLSWSAIQPLELARGRVKLRKEEAKLERLKPEDLADYLEKTNMVSIRKILDILDEEFAAEVISNLNINYQNHLFENFNNNKAARVISLIDPDEAVDILLTFPKKRREQILELLDVKKKKEIEYLFSYAKTPIGGLITSEFLVVSPEDTVNIILEKIKKETADFSLLEYIYVVNKNNQLVGVFNLHELLLHDKNIPVYKFMTQEVIVIHLTTPEVIATKKMIKYKLNALPVIDKEKQIIGIVTLDDLSVFLCNRI